MNDGEPSSHGERSTVLVVEDEENLNTLITEFFDTCNDMDAVVFADIDRAERAVIGGLRPDVALVDFFVSEYGTSARLCRLLKERSPNCVLFVMSGMVTEELAEQAIGFGVDGFFEKPFSFQTLRDKLDRVLAQDRAKTFGFTRFPATSDKQLERLRRLVVDHPNDASYRRILAFSYYVSDRFPEAAAVYATIADPAETTFLSAYYAGHTYARLGKLDKAIANWQRAETLADSDRIAAKVRSRIAMAEHMRAVQ